MGIGVDRVTEKHELDDRDAHDHAEGEAIALELNDLLGYDAQPPRKGKDVVHAMAAGASLALRMRWMNTSSSPGSTSRHVRPGSAISGASAAFSRARLEPVTCS